MQWPSTVMVGEYPGQDDGPLTCTHSCTRTCMHLKKVCEFILSFIVEHSDVFYFISFWKMLTVSHQRISWPRMGPDPSLKRLVVVKRWAAVRVPSLNLALPLTLGSDSHCVPLKLWLLCPKMGVCVNTHLPPGAVERRPGDNTLQPLEQCLHGPQWLLAAELVGTILTEMLQLGWPPGKMWNSPSRGCWEGQVVIVPST